MPEISVIAPVYNVEKYLQCCVDSILEQTFTNFELILVDDGSTDNSGAICDEYAEKDSRVRVIHQSNQGQAAARNRAVDIARGEWVCFVDSDDLIHTQMLEILYNAAVSTDSKISMCTALEAVECPETFYTQSKFICTAKVINELELLHLYRYVEYKSWIVWGKLIHKQIVQRIQFTEGRFYEDNAVVGQWLVEASTVADIDAPLYFYRVNPNGTTKGDSQSRHLDYLWALEEMIYYFRRIGYNSVCRLHIANYMCHVMDKIETLSANSSDERLALLRHLTKKRRKNFIRFALWLKASEDTDGWVLTKAFPKTMWVYWHLCAFLKKLKV